MESESSSAISSSALDGSSEKTFSPDVCAYSSDCCAYSPDCSSYGPDLSTYSSDCSTHKSVFSTNSSETSARTPSNPPTSVGTRNPNRFPVSSRAPHCFSGVATLTGSGTSSWTTSKRKAHRSVPPTESKRAPSLLNRTFVTRPACPRYCFNPAFLASAGYGRRVTFPTSSPVTQKRPHGETSIELTLTCPDLSQPQMPITGNPSGRVHVAKRVSR
mmetsp:Transcript_7960/g.29817  ORF Transcript_7960/g.29817 Transcript_7960/m.29817 type:complete len:216 (-) Transcript_7960:1192-1839(-)